eukprot:1149208-Pelagomonas_calceolata.AAC.3
MRLRLAADLASISGEARSCRLTHEVVAKRRSTPGHSGRPHKHLSSRGDLCKSYHLLPPATITDSSQQKQSLHMLSVCMGLDCDHEVHVLYLAPLKTWKSRYSSASSSNQPHPYLFLHDIDHGLIAFQFFLHLVELLLTNLRAKEDTLCCNNHFGHGYRAANGDKLKQGLRKVASVSINPS